MADTSSWHGFDCKGGGSALATCACHGATNIAWWRGKLPLVSYRNTIAARLLRLSFLILRCVGVHHAILWRGPEIDKSTPTPFSQTEGDRHEGGAPAPSAMP